MKITKWLCIPVLAFGLITVGCGRPDTNVVESEAQTEQEIADADSAYDEEYSQMGQTRE